MLQVNKMQFEERVDGDSEGRMFRVKSTDPRGPSLTYVCQAEDAQTRARSDQLNILQIHHRHCFGLQVDGYDGQAAADTEGVFTSTSSPDCLPQQAVERAVSRAGIVAAKTALTRGGGKSLSICGRSLQHQGSLSPAW